MTEKEKFAPGSEDHTSDCDESSPESDEQIPEESDGQTPKGKQIRDGNDKTPKNDDQFEVPHCSSS